MTFAHGETVDVLSAGSVYNPRSGENDESWLSGVTTVTYGSVGVAAGGSLEPLQDQRDAVESDYDLIFPPDAVVTAKNRVVVRGLTCDVIGRSFLWRNPFTGWTPGLTVQATLREA